MITIILFALFGIFIAIKTVWKDRCEGFSDIMLKICITFFIMICISIVGLVVAFILPMKTKTAVETYNIVSLQDNNLISGNFYLGTGNINGEMKYIFYYENNGEYKMKQIGIDNTSIKYSDSIKCEKYYQELVKSFINWFAIDGDICSESNMKYIIYVPKGTIRENFSLDAQ